MEIKIVYLSITGNTRAFVQHLQAYGKEQQRFNETAPQIILEEIDDNTLPYEETTPFFAFVPTYLEGGNGVDNGDQEILTESLREHIAFRNNAQYCLGIIGSGNKNFNNQYCLTAKQYAEAFAVPLLADYELRGTAADVTRIYELVVATRKEQEI